MTRWILLAALAAGCATNPGPFTYRNNILTTGEGRTLYTYTRDAPGKSHRKPPPQERINKRMGEPVGKQMGQKHFMPGKTARRG